MLTFEICILTFVSLSWQGLQLTVKFPCSSCICKLHALILQKCFSYNFWLNSTLGHKKNPFSMYYRSNQTNPTATRASAQHPWGPTTTSTAAKTLCQTTPTATSQGRHGAPTGVPGSPGVTHHANGQITVFKELQGTHYQRQ